MAQLVAHHTGSVGVRGSSPLSSTSLGLECVRGKRGPASLVLFGATSSRVAGASPPAPPLPAGHGPEGFVLFGGGFATRTPTAGRARSGGFLVLFGGGFATRTPSASRARTAERGRVSFASLVLGAFAAWSRLAAGRVRTVPDRAADLLWPLRAASCRRSVAIRTALKAFHHSVEPAPLGPSRLSLTSRDDRGSVRTRWWWCEVGDDNAPGTAGRSAHWLFGIWRGSTCPALTMLL